MKNQENNQPSLDDFKRLMEKTNNYLNEEAQKKPEIYKKNGGSSLEDVVMNALKKCTDDTQFDDNDIEKISGQKFPDIVVAKRFGVEVKSTEDDHWTSTGNSILETTRVDGVECIYITFGKLGGEQVSFISRLYEECLCEIAVTHMPRYLIDMKLEKGKSIFDKMGIGYDILRKDKNPISHVASYYREHLKKGKERLWWTGDAVDETAPVKMRLWGTLTPEEKRKCIVYGYVHYPKVFGGEYGEYAMWLVSQGIVDTHVRDQFSAGGQEDMELSNGTTKKFPAVYRKIKKYINDFIAMLKRSDMPSKADNQIKSDSKRLEERILNWCKNVSKESKVDYETSMDALNKLFQNHLK